MNLAKLPYQSFIWRYGLEHLKVSYHPSEFGGHRHCARKDMIVLVCYVISQKHAAKRSCDFRDRNPSTQITIMQSLVAIVTLGVEL